ncbi:MAG TPA: metallophosphoesterase [Alphaproteobacteria bacterium]
MPLDYRSGPPVAEDVLVQLEQRLGRLHAKQRLGIETDYEARVFGRGLNFFYLENWYSIHSVLRTALRLTGLYRRGRRNAEDVQVRGNSIAFPNLPPAFDGYTILHITDLHVEMSRGAIDRLIELLPDLDYDVCVLTGDFRARTFGPFDHALEGLERLCGHLKAPAYGVLGNHDTVRMVPGMEAMGIRMLLNESVTVERRGQRIHLAGIDDAHFYRVDNIQKAAERIPHQEFSILLSHTPEIYRQAAHAGFDLLLGGHTHGGQICLPGSVPITLESALPRRMGAGPWRYHDMVGYTSVGVGSSIVAVRLNCPPEIVLHRLRRAEPPAA